MWGCRGAADIPGVVTDSETVAASGCLPGNFTAGKDPCGAHAGGGALTELVTGDDALTEEVTSRDSHTLEAGHAASLAEAVAGLPCLPHKAMGSPLPPSPLHLSRQTTKES